MKSFYVHSTNSDSLRKIAQEAIGLDIPIEMSAVESELAKGQKELHWSVPTPAIEVASTWIRAYVIENELGAAGFLNPSLSQLAVGLCPLIAGLLLIGCTSVPTWSKATNCQRQAEFFKADRAYMQSAERQSSICASVDTVIQLKTTLWTH